MISPFPAGDKEQRGRGGGIKEESGSSYASGEIREATSTKL